MVLYAAVITPIYSGGGMVVEAFSGLGLTSETDHCAPMVGDVGIRSFHCARGMALAHL